MIVAFQIVPLFICHVSIYFCQVTDGDAEGDTGGEAGGDGEGEAGGSQVRLKE